MTDAPATPAPLPLRRRCRCGAPVLRTLTTTFQLELRLDPEPAAAGLYRLTADGLAEAVAPPDAAPGERLYAVHQCSRGEG